MIKNISLYKSNKRFINNLVSDKIAKDLSKRIIDDLKMYEKSKCYYSSFFPVLIFIPFLIIYFDNESFKVENYFWFIIVYIF